MFSEVNGLPVHALVVHAAVIAVPLTALLGVLFAIPRTRAWARVPLALVAVGTAVVVFVAKQSGGELESVLEDNGTLSKQNPATELVKTHQSRANLLFILVLIFAVIAVVAYVLSASAERFTGAVAAVMSVLLVVGAGAIAFQTYRVGDIGAKAVWNPTGDVDYSSE